MSYLADVTVRVNVTFTVIVDKYNKMFNII